MCEVVHRLDAAAVVESTKLGWRLGVTVADEDGAVQQFAPCLLFCCVGKRSAKRFPDLLPIDGVWDVLVPRGFAVGPRVPNEALGEISGSSRG